LQNIFRDGAKVKVKEKTFFFFVDKFFRFTQAGSEVSALLGRKMPCSGRLTRPTLATRWVAMQERITSTKRGSITSVQAFTYLRMI